MASTTGRFPKRNRLTRPSEFRNVHGAGRRSADRYFVVLARDNDLDRARLGCTVARRHLARAVDRNRVKRLVRESFRTHQQALRGLDIIVILRRAPGDASNEELSHTLARHWNRLSPCDTPSSD